MTDQDRDQAASLFLIIVIILITVIGVSMCGCGATPEGALTWACPDPHCCVKATNGECRDYGCCDPGAVP